MGHHIPIPAVDPCESLRLAHRLRSVTLSLPTSDPEVTESLNGAFRRNYMIILINMFASMDENRLRWIKIWMNMDEYD
jgi:hypothetical protein